jgi:ankyrin repeat protein
MSNIELITAIKCVFTEKALHIIDELLSQNSIDFSYYLLLACECNIIKIIDKLCNISNINININTTDLNGNTCLMIATRHSNTRIVKLLLEKNADPNIQNIYGETPLLYICNANITTFCSSLEKINIASRLIEYKSNLEVKNKYNRTPLHLSLINRDLNLVEFLLNANANVNTRDIANVSILLEICKLETKYLNEKTIEMFTSFVLQKVDINETYVSNIISNNLKKTTCAILESIFSNNIIILQKLIELKANVNVYDENNISPLIHAIQSNKRDDCITLINAGADVNAINFSHCSDYSVIMTTVIMTTVSINTDIFDILLKTNKIDYNYKNRSGQNIYEFLLLNRYVQNNENLIKFNEHTLNMFKCNKLMELIMQSNLCSSSNLNLTEIKQNLHLINEVDSLGNSVLYYALVSNTHEDILDLLLNNSKVNLFFVNNKNETIRNIRSIKQNRLSSRFYLELNYKYNIDSCKLLSKYLHKDVINSIIYKYITDSDIDAIFNKKF